MSLRECRGGGLSPRCSCRPPSNLAGRQPSVQLACARHGASRVRSPPFRTSFPLHRIARRPPSCTQPDPLSRRPPAWPCPSSGPCDYTHLGHVAGRPVHRCHPYCQHRSGGELLDRRALQVRSVEGQRPRPEGDQQFRPRELDLACRLKHNSWALAHRGDV